MFLKNKYFFKILFYSVDFFQNVINRQRRSEDPNRRYGCQFCKYTTDYLKDLKKHVLIHTGERNYVCSFCGKRFLLLHHLKYHLKALHSVVN